MPHEQQNIIHEIRDLRMILRVQYILLLVFIAAVILYVYLGHNHIYEDSYMLSLRLTILNSGLFILFFVISFFTKRHILQTLKQKLKIELSDVKKYRNLYYFRAALFETVCMFSILIFLFWGVSYSLIPALVSVLLLKMYYPSTSKVSEEINLNDINLTDR